MIADILEDVERARYPKKVRDVAKLEAEAVEMGSYDNSQIDGLLQTKDYAEALFGERRPPHQEAVLERYVASRTARQEVLTSQTSTVFTFVQEEVTLRRPIGGGMVLRRQLEPLLEIGHMRHIEIQVMPTATECHAGLAGPFRLLTPSDGIIRSQAYNRKESLALIKKVLEET